MSDETKTRKPNTPQLERVVDAIRRGDYDENLIELHRALTARQDVLKAQVLEQVRQIFGPDADITVPKTPPMSFERPGFEGKPNAFIEKAEREAETTRPAPPPPITERTADQLDENRVTKDPLENVQSDAGMPVSEVERRMLSGEQIVDIEHRGAIISGLSSANIGD